jgi:hypothetical protein
MKEGDEKERRGGLVGRIGGGGNFKRSMYVVAGVWLLAQPQPPPVHLLHYGRAPRKEGTEHPSRRKNSLF